MLERGSAAVRRDTPDERVAVRNPDAHLAIQAGIDLAGQQILQLKLAGEPDGLVSRHESVQADKVAVGVKIVESIGVRSDLTPSKDRAHDPCRQDGNRGVD